jgi:hypothetical protein
MNQIPGKVSPTVQKSARVWGEGFAPRAKVQTDFRARFCPLGYGLPEISGEVLQPLHSYAQNLGKVLHTLQKFKPDLRHTSATPAKLQTESRAHFCYLCVGLNRFLGMYKEKALGTTGCLFAYGVNLLATTRYR